VLHPPTRRLCSHLAIRGHATRALTLLLQYAQSIGIAQAEADVAADNLASRRVAEKTGFHLASTFTGEDGTDMIRYQAWLKTSRACQGSSEADPSHIKRVSAKRWRQRSQDGTHSIAFVVLCRVTLDMAPAS